MSIIENAIISITKAKLSKALDLKNIVEISAEGLQEKRDIPYMLGVIALIILCGMLAFKTNKFDVGIVSIISILSFAYFPISFFNEDGASGAAPAGCV